MKTNGDPKEKGRIRRRNQMAKHMLSDNRKQYTERKVPSKKHKDTKFRNNNIKRIYSGDYKDDEIFQRDAPECESCDGPFTCHCDRRDEGTGE